MSDKFWLAFWIIAILFVIFSSNKKKGRGDDENSNDKTYKPFRCHRCNGTLRRLCENCHGYPGQFSAGCSTCNNTGFTFCRH